MENAAKALEIAGGVLISLMIIGLLVWGYNHLSALKKTQSDVTAQEQAVNFNNAYEEYNKDGLYGTQILSIANQVYDYNKNESDKNGYTEMELSVTFNKLDSNTYIKNGTYNANELTNAYNNLEKAIVNKAKDTVTTDSGAKYTYKDLSTMNSNTLSELFKNENYIAILKPYTDLTEEQSSISRSKFKAPQVVYDKNTGRLTSMTFEQQ